MSGSGLKKPQTPESSQQSAFLGKEGSVVSPCRLPCIRAFVLEVRSWSGNDVPINSTKQTLSFVLTGKGQVPKVQLSPSALWS